MARSLTRLSIACLRAKTGQRPGRALSLLQGTFPTCRVRATTVHTSWGCSEEWGGNAVTHSVQELAQSTQKALITVDPGDERTSWEVRNLFQIPGH